jgi:hypothetical protein
VRGNEFFFGSGLKQNSRAEQQQHGDEQMHEYMYSMPLALLEEE